MKGGVCILETVIKIMVFQIGEERYGIELSGIKKIDSSKSFNEDEQMILFQSKAVPVLDLHRKFHADSKPAYENMIIILMLGKRLLALKVDKIEAVFTIPIEECSDIPIILTGNGETGNIFKTIISVDTCLVPVFSLEQLFAE